jgi:hypothetical protein
MDSDERVSEKPFKVQDRRRFSATGEARPESEVPPDEPAAAASEPPPSEPPPRQTRDASQGQAQAQAHAARGADEHARHDHHELSFATFVISLSTQALALLGEIPDPVQGKTAVDLEGARQFIDILGILQDKTRGNLDAREAALLEGALYDLRMKFVERANR